MENASKALIIAGAILISILIISLGIMIYNQASSIVQGNQLQDFEITAFNTKFTQYEGNKTGAQVRTLIQEIISSNSNPENESRLIEVDFAGTWAGTKPGLNRTVLTYSTSIKANSKYSVSFDYGSGGTTGHQDGLIYKCTITPN